jgi:hypothetical protein
VTAAPEEKAMTRIIIDAAMREEEGPFEPQVSEEELERRSHSNEPVYTTDEVLAHLEKL